MRVFLTAFFTLTVFMVWGVTSSYSFTMDQGQVTTNQIVMAKKCKAGFEWDSDTKKCIRKKTRGSH